MAGASVRCGCGRRSGVACKESAGRLRSLRLVPLPLAPNVDMSRIFGFLVGALWLVFSLLAFRNSAYGWSEGHSDLGFWWAVIGVLLLVASAVALVGTSRHRASGPVR